LLSKRSRSTSISLKRSLRSFFESSTPLLYMSSAVFLRKKSKMSSAAIMPISSSLSSLKKVIISFINVWRFSFGIMSHLRIGFMGGCG
jgi:hypothetical protein